MGNHFGEHFSVLPKVQEFPTSVGCFHEIAVWSLFRHNFQKNVFINVRMCLLQDLVHVASVHTYILYYFQVLSTLHMHVQCDSLVTPKLANS